MRSAIRAAPALAAALIAAACGAEPTAAPPLEVTVRDSAGIAIVENTMDTAAARLGWEIAASPRLTIGGVEADEAAQLYGVSGGRRLADGRIVVADRGSAEVRVYGADGALLATHGSEGEGPGEFQRPTLAGLAGSDTIVVYDSNLRRVSYVHPDDGFVRSYQIGSEGGGFPVAIGVLEDGGLAVGGGMSFSSAQGFPDGAVRPNSRYALLAPDGTIRGDLGEIPAAEMFARSQGGNFMVTSIPLGRSTVAAASREALWLGLGNSWELRAYDADAALERIVRFDRPAAPVTDALWQAEIDERVSDAEDANTERQQRERYAAMPRPETLPFYENLEVDQLGNVWIGEYLATGETARTYTITDPEGRATGRVTFPPRTRPLEIGEDYVLAVSFDELDVERLTMWGLTRPGTERVGDSPRTSGRLPETLH